MDNAEHVEPKPPKPNPVAYIAAALELGMLGVFAWERSIVGALLWLAYYWFSATRAMVADAWRRD